MTRKRTDYIVIHHSATPPEMDIGVKEIDRWHRQAGSLEIGYHYVIRRDGTVEEGRPDEVQGAHCRGYNSVSVGVCLVGGTKAGGNKEPENNYTRKQMIALENLVAKLATKFIGVAVIGHKDLHPEGSPFCPMFDIPSWLKSVEGFSELEAAGINFGPPTNLRIGMLGKEVGMIQKALGIEADDMFGPLTHASVEEFQSNNGLEIDGVVGPKTWRLLMN